MTVAVVYAAGSRIIRRVIVSDGDALKHAALVDGEAALEIPEKTYREASAEDVAAYVAERIGPPLHDGRCVEVDKQGEVVAVYLADPVIDKPRYSLEHSIEVSKTAEIGQVKDARGQFVAKADLVGVEGVK